MKWTSCQKEALKLLKDGGNIFLTGVAGSGKSRLIQHFLADKDRKRFPVVASTGAAALLVGGRTFHSFFGLGILEGGVDATVEKALRDRRLIKRLERAETVVIDEISMVPGPALKAAETISRLVRGKTEAWGGLRIIAVGDFGQLPPVAQYGENRQWAFHDSVWRKTEFTSAILRTVVRSKDQLFSEILSKVRAGDVDQEVSDFLESRMARPETLDSITRLFPRRAQTDKFNFTKLQALKGDERIYPTVFTGTERAVKQLEKNAPIGAELRLKEDAFVMLRQNDPRDRWVNGSLGFVRKMGSNEIRIELLNGRVVEIERVTFSLLDAEGKVTASATNFPISLAWATTIHKSQGATLDRAMMDLKNLWEPGQAYVALSRVSSPEGLFIEGWSPLSFKVDPEVVEFHNQIGL